jgi:hypothetical protein
MTDMVLCYGSADGVALRAQALYRECFRCVVFRIRKHFWVLSTGKWYFSTEPGVRPRTSNFRHGGRKPVNKYLVVSLWQGLHPYHV